MRTTGLAVLALTATLGVSGCARTEYVTLQPQCEPVVVPALPILEKGELWQALGDSQYRQLERYIHQLWSFADEQSAMLDAICGSN